MLGPRSTHYGWEAVNDAVPERLLAQPLSWTGRRPMVFLHVGVDECTSWRCVILLGPISDRLTKPPHATIPRHEFYRAPQAA